MRSFLAGLLILLLSSGSFAQVRGEVESIGFGNGLYRPECWTPMVIRLDSQISDPAEYRIEIHQRDLDFDHVIYVKDGITLNGHATQRWEVDFLPQPTNGGLPDGSIPDLQNRLQVYLTTKDGSKRLLQLPITSSVQSLEPNLNGFSRAKGNKLILYIAQGGSRPAWSGYDKAIGLIEQPIPVRVAPRELPQSVLAYQAVDAVVWISGDARVLDEQGSRQLAALQQWVRQGGMLVVCQPSSDGDRQTIAPFADMLPILWQANGQWQVSEKMRKSLEPLPTLAAWKNVIPDRPPSWDLKGEFPLAHAIARPNAIVDQTIDWNDDGKDVTPYIARIPYGLGSVTWVAQDLGDPRITGPHTSGWPYVWDKVFGWKNDTYVPGDTLKRNEDEYAVDFMTGPVDLGAAQLAGVEFRSKGAGLIGLAVLFFVIYWIVAGPGMYLFLAGRRRKELSWTVFGVIAMAATLLTVLVVRLVLRGSPEIHHATDVRIVSGQQAQPAIAYSRIGLYIPRDGSQRVSLTDTSADFVSYVTPMPIYPGYVPDNEFPANLDYTVPVREEGSPDPVGIDIPFRSTLKKLQAKWCGPISGTVRANDVTLNPTGGSRDPIRGTLDNLTGIDFKNVYIAFHYNNEDYVLYLPTWSAAAGQNRVNLGAQYAKAGQLPLGGISGNGGTTPEDQRPCSGQISAQWAYYWAQRLKGAGDRADDLGQAVPVSFPVLSFFDRIPPSKKDPQGITKALTLLRRGARNLNMSQALETGELVVLAQASGQPLPFPFLVNGSKVDGTGQVFYQYALPMDHAVPATQPAQ